MPILEDRRLGGLPLLLLLSEQGCLMRIPEAVTDCAAFVGRDEGKGRGLVGTCFFVAVEVGSEHYVTYAVTAAHLVERSRKRSIDKMVYIRMNKAGGGTQWVATAVDSWRFHPTDPRVDVAIVPFNPPVDLVDFAVYSTASAATEEKIKSEGIGVGDEVFITGLFVNHYGAQRNIPIVRIGNIAAMPAEPVETESRGPMDAYLIEARSIGGLSGSPVFVSLGLVRSKEGQTMLATKGKGPYYLLGLVHGHYQVRATPAEVEEDGLPEESVNMGIAIVVPVAKILEVINSPELVEQRELLAREGRAAKLPVEDSSTGA